ncbi:hypothetical protein BJV85_001103 [Clostridium acetobutylicum]|uniref:Uncharacterized protein n=1 Tax=Clostridium acetobutylicum (strain ATCC 824 / DSM 792 / JCM 1419 / IAM 19013 / LMG 5710 / NBRC 13948 / NRRL B-527 / VKM B-1787 / 2291 / W) TaxID=272562 RepID=Q97FF0_CLOAB|nr:MULTISPECIES: hypothetical protein [Clostridium]AAK80734.1 Hypothetical protein CA_C2790 [Clostridium acetobutylicum ATCC 824]ADZ21835.1 Conserved hypothetical protein [Clostridium acetobutylicum EA 2018]AEI32552.1 hypothetical protein SMB_G2826 [Clostridium acetobutylicum DSM 1731]AWV78852.1 hypothetical protein DK921_01745 [Clostridium acetobutylicum]KHD37100.1 hypothetical protein NL50_07155 [Clostridium acetobutylicum]
MPKEKKYQKKSATNNQWSSLPEENFDKSQSKGKSEKSALNNQWTSTIKNSTDDK